MCSWFFCNLEQVWFSPPSCTFSLILLVLTTCFFRGMMANIDINAYIIARENLFHPCKIVRKTPVGHLQNWWYHIQTPASARTICDHARENSVSKRVSIRRWFANRWNRTASVLFVTIWWHTKSLLTDRQTDSLLQTYRPTCTYVHCLNS